MHSRIAFLVAFASFAIAQNLQTCRILPTDSSWPSKYEWDAFNSSIDGRLIKTVPIGSPCHDPTFDEAQCNTVRENWHDPEFHEPNPSSLMDPIFLNKSCDPFDSRDTPCRIGAYVQYAVNVSTIDHVAKTIGFVKGHNIRFVVKNTGHDYMGRSTGTGAVSVWMHNLQNITFLPQYKSSTYSGPAFKASAGVLGKQLASAASAQGLAAVVGECPTVGAVGGYTQGGGHSALSSMYGLAADQALEFEVITAQGKFVRASPRENKDLYWALSGGGGGAYGIVWTMTVKVHKDLPVTIASINFTADGLAQDKYWEAIDAYQGTTPNFTDARMFTLAQYTDDSFKLYPIFAPNKTTAETSALIQPFLNTLDRLGVNYTTAADMYDGYLPAYDSVGMWQEFPIAIGVTGSRILPRSLWEDQTKLSTLKKTIRGIVDGGGAAFDFSIRPTLATSGNPQNAVLPAWRNAERLFLTILPQTDGESVAQMFKDQNKITTQYIKPLVDLTPGSGSYPNEADSFDPNWKQAFYGSTYDKLLSIKNKWDPDQILYGRISVGGDRWRETAEGRLCKVRA
ncbi:hypothetical protein V5O48_017423 [Marasmius crinis-equi]|uniref:FAD-binding PCMH-type domain-containing protein n=1 Tax=Marasmius crinis-equi TaxID=585013 RepID=A0ABR3EP16_9AGAR